MSTLTDVLMIIGLFTLRIGVPLAVIVSLAYLLKRLDRRWEAEARKQMGITRPAEQGIEQPARRSEVPEPTSQLCSKAGISPQQSPTDLTQVRQPEVADRVNDDRRS